MSFYEIGPIFDECPPEARVDETDADYVDFIHTDSGRLPALSMAANVGDAGIKEIWNQTFTALRFLRKRRAPPARMPDAFARH